MCLRYMVVKEQTKLFMVISFIIIRKRCAEVLDMNKSVLNMEIKFLIILFLMRYSGSLNTRF